MFVSWVFHLAIVSITGDQQNCHHVMSKMIEANFYDAVWPNKGLWCINMWKEKNEEMLPFYFKGTE